MKISNEHVTPEQLFEKGKELREQRKFEEAFKYYQTAAEQEYAPAQYVLSLCYKYGQGVEKDKDKSLYWCKLAAKQGLKTAQLTLRSHINECFASEKEEPTACSETEEPSDYSSDCITLSQLYTNDFILKHGSEEECRQKITNCAKRFDVLFPHFFSVAKKSFDEKEFNRSPKGDDLFYYIEENLFFILKKYFFITFNNSSLEELSDLLDFFRLLNSESPYMNYHALSASDETTYNRDYIIDEFLCIIDSDYEELKILNLANALDCNNTDVLTTYNKIPQPKEVLYSSSRNNKSDYSPFYSHYFSFNFFIEDGAHNSFLEVEPDYRGVRSFICKEGKKLTDILKPSRNDNKEAFEFMCNFWYTYKTLTFNVCREKDAPEDLIPASEEERKELVNDFKKLVFSLVEKEADYLSCSAAFELCYIFSCAHYLNKTDESLLDLLVFSYVISYAQLHNIQKIKDVPEEIRKLCYCRDGITAYDVLEKTNKLITGYLHI